MPPMLAGGQKQTPGHSPGSAWPLHIKGFPGGQGFSWMGVGALTLTPTSLWVEVTAVLNTGLWRALEVNLAHGAQA